MKGMENMKYL